MDEQRNSPGSMPRWRREFPGTEIQLRHMRRWIENLLPKSPSRDSVISIACEYASNAVLHSLSGQQGGSFVVELLAGYGSTVRVMVTDCGGPKEPHLLEPCGGYEEHGRGLRMVKELSVRSGVKGDATGRTSWADVIWVVSPAPAPLQLMIDSTTSASRRTWFGQPFGDGPSGGNRRRLPDRE